MLLCTTLGQSIIFRAIFTNTVELKWLRLWKEVEPRLIGDPKKLLAAQKFAGEQVMQDLGRH